MERRQLKVSPQVIQMKEETWYALEAHELTECCGCGLVHETEFKFEGRHIFWRAHVNKRATQAARKRDGIKVVRTH